MIYYANRLSKSPMHYKHVETVAIEHFVKLELKRPRRVRYFYCLSFCCHSGTEPVLGMYYVVGASTRLLGGWGGSNSRNQQKKGGGQVINLTVTPMFSMVYLTIATTQPHSQLNRAFVLYLFWFLRARTQTSRPTTATYDKRC